MLIKTERLCKTGYQKCLPRGDSANEVYLLKLPIKVMFSRSFLPGRGEKNKIKWETDTSGFYHTLKYFIKSFILLPNKMHRQSAQIPLKCNNIHKADVAFELYKLRVTRQNQMLPSVLPAVLLFAVAAPELRSQ